MPSWLIWLVVAVVVVVVLALLLAVSGRRKRERDRSEAGQLREEAASRAPQVAERDDEARRTGLTASTARAEADRSRAEAERQHAEADRQHAEADRLETEAAERRRSADQEREDHLAGLSRADDLDPSVDTRAADYTGPETDVDHRGSGHDLDDGLLDTSATEAEMRRLQDGPEPETTTVTHPDGSTEQVDPDSTDPDPK